MTVKTPVVIDKAMSPAPITSATAKPAPKSAPINMLVPKFSLQRDQSRLPENRLLKLWSVMWLTIVPAAAPNPPASAIPAIKSAIEAPLVKGAAATAATTTKASATPTNSPTQNPGSESISHKSES
jgi:hypothetical protein